MHIFLYTQILWWWPIRHQLWSERCHPTAWGDHNGNEWSWGGCDRLWVVLTNTRRDTDAEDEIKSAYRSHRSMYMYIAQSILFIPTFDITTNFLITTIWIAGLGSSVECAFDWWSGDREFAAPVRQHSFVEIDHETFSTVILSLLLIQEGKLSVACERMCTEYWLTS